MLFAAKGSAADMVLCGYTIQNGLRTVQAVTYEKQTFFEGTALLKEYLAIGVLTETVTAKLFEAKFFDNIWFPAMRMSEDAFILPRLLGMCRKAIYVPECFYVQTIRTGSTENLGFSLKYLTRLECEDELERFIRVEHPEFLPLIRARKLDGYIILMRMIARGHDYREYKTLYWDLAKKADEEWEKVCAFPESAAALPKDTKLAHNSKRLFLFKHMVLGVFLKAKQILKKMIICMKSKM